MKMMEPNGNGKLTMEKYFENTELQREFHDKWKPKNTNKILDQALFELYGQTNLEGIADEYISLNSFSLI